MFTANMHTDAAASDGSDAIISAATARGVPVISARQMFQWVDGRNASSFGSIGWAGNTLHFTVSVAAGSTGFRRWSRWTRHPGRLTGITRGGNPITFRRETIKGEDYAFFPARRATYQAMYAVDGRRRSSRASSPRRSEWNGDDHVDDGRGLDLRCPTERPGPSLRALRTALATSHSVVLTGLAEGTTYYFRVRSTDAAGNTAVSRPHRVRPRAS